jgi:hypothetical protein
VSIRSKGQKFANFMTGSPEPGKEVAPGKKKKRSLRGFVQGLAKVGTALSAQDAFILGHAGKPGGHAGYGR